MSVSRIDFEEIQSPINQIKLSAACSVIAKDCESEELAILYNCPHVGGTIVVVYLAGFQVLFEGPQLLELSATVKRLKGSTCFKIASHEPRQWPKLEHTPTNRIKDSFPCDCDDDDDDLPWWKGGGK